MKINRLLLLFLIVNTILAYFFKPANFWYFVSCLVLIVFPYEVFRRLGLDHTSIGPLIIGYTVAFAVGFILAASLSTAIILGLTSGFVFSFLSIIVRRDRS